MIMINFSNEIEPVGHSNDGWWIIDDNWWWQNNDDIDDF